MPDPIGLVEPTSTYAYAPGNKNEVQAVTNLGEREGAPDAGEAFRHALHEPFGFTLVVHRQRGSAAEIVAFEIAFLMRDRTSERLQKGREPFEALLKDSAHRLFPGEDEVGRRNATLGLDGVLSHFVVSRDLPAGERGRVRAQMASTFVDLYAGNRVRNVFYQVRGREAVENARPGGYEPIATYNDLDVEGVEHPFLLRYNDHNPLHHNLLLTRFLQYRTPVLRLPPGGREVLRFASMGETDAQIVARHGIRPSSLNSRWTRVLDIAEAKMPRLFEGSTGGKSRDRLPLLTYVRNHPEELWPYVETSSERTDTGRRTS